MEGVSGRGQARFSVYATLICCYTAMSRPLRVEFSGAIYHVTCRGNGRQQIFHSDGDYQRLLRAGLNLEAGEHRVRYTAMRRIWLVFLEHRLEPAKST
jgi:hypothetical protein